MVKKIYFGNIFSEIRKQLSENVQCFLSFILYCTEDMVTLKFRQKNNNMTINYLSIKKDQIEKYKMIPSEI